MNWPTHDQLRRCLPPVHTLLFSLRATADMRLSPLPTTAVHGALGHALAELCCPTASVSECRHDSASSCLYRRLFAPAQQEEGTPPPALVLSPEAPYLRDEAQPLTKGSTLDLRVTLIGSEAVGSQGLVIAALRRVAERGIGIASHGHRKVPMLLLDVQVAAKNRADCQSEAILDFITPARLIQAGRTHHTLSTELLWSCIARRAETLSRWYGQGPLIGGTAGAVVQALAPFSTRSSHARRVQVRRYSSRQRKRMEWSAVMGVTTMHGPELHKVWPVLEFASQVQIGKSTSFGFGRFQLTPMLLATQ